MNNPRYEQSDIERQADNVGLSAGQKVVFGRLREFFGDFPASDFLNEYSQSPQNKRCLISVAYRVLVRGQTRDNVNMVAFSKERFCSFHDDVEVVFDR